jgi:hypothetical protein
VKNKGRKEDTKRKEGRPKKDGMKEDNNGRKESNIVARRKEGRKIGISRKYIKEGRK